MARRYAEITYTESVRAAQERAGVAELAARMTLAPGDDTRLGPAEQLFIAERDSFYMASVAESGWPYVQHRGGPRGFLRVIDERTLAFADFRGNLQLLSTGNVTHDDRVSLFLMDYPNQRRLKILARARIVDAGDDPELVSKTEDPSYRAKTERVFVFDIEAFDWNCPQHITPRFTVDEVAKLSAKTDGPFSSGNDESP